jgi:uncharacterized phage-like protein YoqJ
VPYDAFIPFEGQESRWPPAAQAMYRMLLGRAASVHVETPNSTTVAASMQLRNMRIVNGSDLIVAVWDGSKHGGTYAAIEYAESVHVPVVNLWS